MAASTHNVTRYERLHQHNETSTSLLLNPSSSSSTSPRSSLAEDDDLSPNVGYQRTARSSVRRRNQGYSQRVKPSPRPISAMSLVGLKNLFFRQSITPAPVRERKPDGDYDSDKQPNANDSTTDLESQSTITSSSTYNKKGFKLDARVISDATIGLSDGLTVPFALTAGLSALGSTKVVIYGGFAELIAGAISMGLGGYLGAKSEAASYKALLSETEQQVATDPTSVLKDLNSVFEPYSLPPATLTSLTTHLSTSPSLPKFLLHFHHCESAPASNRAITSALTISIAYFLGGLLPLIPYICVRSGDVYEGLYISIGVMVLALFTFGYTKTGVIAGWKGGRNVRKACWGGVQMVVVGSAAAGCAMGLVRGFNREGTGEVEMSS